LPSPQYRWIKPILFFVVTSASRLPSRPFGPVDLFLAL